MALPVTGCTWPHTCTLIGVPNGMVVKLDAGIAPADPGRPPAAPLEVHACLDTTCVDETVADPSFPSIVVPFDKPSARVATATVRVTRGGHVLSDGMARVQFVRDEPNGKGCGDAYQVGVTATSTGLRADGWSAPPGPSPDGTITAGS